MKPIPAFCLGLALVASGNAQAAERLSKGEIFTAYCHEMADKASEIDGIFVTKDIPGDVMRIYDQVFWDCMRANGLEPPDP
jgi:hypothetical protein